MGEASTIVESVAAGLWPVRQLRPHPQNPRGEVLRDAAFGEMVASIRAQGVLQPLVATPDGTVVAGHRRLEAATEAGLRHIPVVVRDLTPAQQVACMLAENLIREDLTPVQEARGYRQLLALGMTRADIARQTGVTSQRVGDHLVLLELDPLAQELFGRRELPVTLVRSLAKIVDPARQRQVASLVAKRLLTVMDVRQLVETEPAVTKPAPSLPPAETSRQTAPRTASRTAALSAIRQRSGAVVPVARLGDAMEQVCGICDECGCKDIELICAACPLPQYVVRVLA